MKKIILLIMMLVLAGSVIAWDPNPVYDPFDVVWNYLADTTTSWVDGTGKVTTNVSVGIGISSPVTKLQVDGRILSTEPIAFSNFTLWNNHRYDPSKMQHRLSVSAGGSHTCVLRSNGNVDCYGDNTYGQDADYNNRDAIGVSAGWKHTCVLKSNGNVDCYGFNNEGQSNNYTSGDAIGVSAGYYHTCVLRSNGDVDCYGDNYYGQDADYTNGDAIGVAAGYYHTCVLRSNGDVDCYGDSTYGQDADYTNGDAIGVAAGGWHTCVLRSNGNVDCYGDNYYGQDADYTNGDAIGVSAGWKHTCVLKSNGNVDCYGNNDHGRSDNYISGDAIGVSGWGDHTCVLKANGNADCYGWDGDGQAADYTNGDAMNPFNSLWEKEDYLWSFSGEDVYRMSGNVGIGTSTTSEKLTVNGIIQTTSGGFKFPDGTIQTTASMSGVKQLINEFVVASGESVTAGDVVNFVNGYVKKGEDNIISYGSEYEVNTASSDYISVAALSSNKFVVVYRDEGNSGYGTAVIGSVSGTTITYGSEYVFNTASTTYLSVDTLDSGNFVVVYKDDGNSGYGTAVIGSVSGTTITYDPEYVFNTASTTYLSVDALASNKFVVAYSDDGNSGYGTARVGSVSGTTITYDPEYVFNTAYSNYISVAALESTKFVVAYSDGGISYYGTAVIGSVSGTLISYGSEYVFNTVNSYGMSVAALASNKFVVVYIDQGNSGYGTAVIGSVSGTVVSYGSEYVFNTASTSYMPVAALASNKFVVLYRDEGNSFYGTGRIGSVSGNIIWHDSEYVFNTARTLYMSVDALASNKFVVVYRDEGNSFYGTAIVGDIIDSKLVIYSETVGIAKESKAASETLPVIIGGVSDVHSSLVTGSIYYSDVYGDLTTTQTNKKIGLAISSTEIILNNNDWW